MSPVVQIEYCTQCRWLPRAAWLAQELLTTFETELTELSLKPGTGGVFVVRVDDEVVWDRRDQGFPSRRPSSRPYATEWPRENPWATRTGPRRKRTRRYRAVGQPLSCSYAGRVRKSA